jgi:Transposase IS4
MYFDAVKRPGVKDKALPRPSTNRQGLWVLRKLYAIDQYNKQMGGADSHAQQNSYYSTAKHWHRRNWWPLFFFLVDAAVTNSYLLYKLLQKQQGNEKPLSHVAFQTEIALKLLRQATAILRKRSTHRPKPDELYNPTDAKEAVQGHRLVKQGPPRACRACQCVQPRPGRPRGALQEISGNADPVLRRAKRKVIRTSYICGPCGLPICNSSKCFQRHVNSL